MLEHSPRKPSKSIESRAISFFPSETRLTYNVGNAFLAVILKWAKIKYMRMIEYYDIYNFKALELFFKIVYKIVNKMFHFIMQSQTKKLSELFNIIQKLFNIIQIIKEFNRTT
jgi:hypothetical protein